MSHQQAPTVSFDLECDSIVKDNVLPPIVEATDDDMNSFGSPGKQIIQIGEKLLRPRDLACHENTPNPGRPQFLGELIDGMQDSLGASEVKYKDFVAASQNTLIKEKTFDALAVSCTLRYTKPEKYSDSENAGAEISNSMVYTFMFYAAMQQAGSASFQATEIANETLSYYELDKFCRDFNIVPRLLTKAEVKTVWQDFIQIFVQQTGGTPPQALNFEQFKDMFVRMALFAFNKVGMKRMILAVTGFFPSPEDLVQSLCDYCHFHDFPKVQEIIRTLGRETQGALNFRSSGDNNNRARAEIRIDLRAKYLARVSAKENKEKEEKERRRLQKMRMKQGLNESEQNDKGRAKTVQYGMWSATAGKKFKQGGEWGNWQRKSKRQRKLPNFLEEMLQGAVHADSFDAEESVQGSKVGSQHGSASSSVSGNQVADEKSEVGSEDLMTYDKATAIAKERGTRLDFIAEQYNKDLQDVLTKYCRTDPAPEKAGVIESNGPFLDAGHLPPRTQCSLLLNITNLTMDTLQLDVSAEGFDDTDTKVIINPNPVVSGIQRQGNVKFSIPNRLGGKLAFVNITAVSAGGLTHTLKCPVFYRSDSTSSNRCLLNLKSLPKLCEIYLGHRFSASSNFLKTKREENPVWVRPVSAHSLRRSVHELRPLSRVAQNAVRALSSQQGRRPTSAGFPKRNAKSR